jgi:hypothetical protein
MVILIHRFKNYGGKHKTGRPTVLQDWGSHMGAVEKWSHLGVKLFELDNSYQFQMITRPSKYPQLFTSWHSIRTQKMWIISSNLTMQYIFQSFWNTLDSSALSACHYDDVLWHNDITQDGHILFKFFALTWYVIQYHCIYLAYNNAAWPSDTTYLCSAT